MFLAKTSSDLCNDFEKNQTKSTAWAQDNNFITNVLFAQNSEYPCNNTQNKYILKIVVAKIFLLAFVF